MRRIVVGISGSSGAIYGIRLLEALQSAKGVETHLIISEWASETIRLETDYSLAQVSELADKQYEQHDLAARISSGSFMTSGMVVVPASMKTVAAIAAGYTSNLIIRAADVAIKERRQLILVPRETPLSPIHLENLLKLSRIGVTILPPVPGFYTQPQTIDELVAHTVGKILDHLGIKHRLFTRWGSDR